MSEPMYSISIASKRHAATEKFEFTGFTCSTCYGKGGHDNSGYLEKFKKNLDDPDWVPCPLCAGSGKQKAIATVEWLPDKK